MKKILALVLVALMALVAMPFAMAEGDGEPIEIAVVIKATDSDFWQQLLVGALNFDYEHDDVNVTTYGPVSEADYVEQATILDGVVVTHPDGIVLSNGPGNPEDVTPVIGLVRQLRGKLPIFGICMGHQLISLAYGAKTVKMKFGHRGGNHPVKNLETGRIEITSQNHSYAVDIDSLAATGLRLTHVNLLDGTAEGVECAEDGVFSMQYHPESASGPQDSSYLFKKFTKIMEERKNA